MTRIMLIASVLALTSGLPAAADTAHSVRHDADTAKGETLSWTLSGKFNSNTDRAQAIFDLIEAQSD
ncbi:hypothetical protein ACMU_13245 [Actibacterium mucosum KCTC 23349]|uniref:Uncharacterized protein n=1 Tax=Actibacterium mucosum KCTC 23349 TaxID=1454373 RepID=A0A037ZLC8_9RHOB|nr:hypothetical protein [Actibacterium mucosum]KAJ55651.1 hypothetical protein ACMU_13245 [Actibacterium mucosum KCTC 23349]